MSSVTPPGSPLSESERSPALPPSPPDSPLSNLERSPSPPSSPSFWASIPAAAARYQPEPPPAKSDRSQKRPRDSSEEEDAPRRSKRSRKASPMLSGGLITPIPSSPAVSKDGDPESTEKPLTAAERVAKIDATLEATVKPLPTTIEGLFKQERAGGYYYPRVGPSAPGGVRRLKQSSKPRRQQPGRAKKPANKANTSQIAREETNTANSQNSAGSNTRKHSRESSSAGSDKAAEQPALQKPKTRSETSQTMSPRTPSSDQYQDASESPETDSHSYTQASTPPTPDTVFFFDASTTMAPSIFQKTYPGSVFHSTGKVSGYEWTLTPDGAVRILQSASKDSCVWGAVYIVSSDIDNFKTETAKERRTKVSLFQRDQSIGWFGDESEANGKLLLTGIVDAYVLVSENDENTVAVDEAIADVAGVAERTRTEEVERAINKGIVECCLDVDFVKNVLRKWIPQPAGPVGVYWEEVYEGEASRSFARYSYTTPTLPKKDQDQKT